MSIFNQWKKQDPPPPPKVPTIVTIFIPIVMGIIIGLIGLVYNTMASDVEEVKVHVQKVEEKKVDNTTLRLMLNNQTLLIQQQKEQADRQRKEDSKKFEQIQRTQIQTLQRIEKLQNEQGLKAPSLSDIKKGKELTPELFEKYFKITNSKVRSKYKKYLEYHGYDVTGLDTK